MRHILWDELIEPLQGVHRAVGVNRGAPARVARVPGLEEIEGLGPANLADDDSVGSQPNLVISGGPGSGKTTFANAVIREMEWLAPRAERFLIIEDTHELHCTLPNHVTLDTTEAVTLRDLVRAAILPVDDGAPEDVRLVGGKDSLSLVSVMPPTEFEPVSPP